MNSMTAYGRGEARNENIAVVSEIRGLNSKGLDIRCVVPDGLNHLFMKIQSMVREYVNRGRVEVFVAYEALGSAGEFVDSKAAGSILKKVRWLELLYGREVLVGVKDLLTHSVLSHRKFLVDNEDVFVRSLKLAMEDFNSVRRLEGEGILEDILGRLEFIERSVKDIESRKEFLEENLRSRLFSRLEEIAQDLPVDFARRVEYEVALLIDKQDISEELMRLRFHAGRFREVAQSDKPCGKMLDFLCQEMMREANTLGSKLRDTDVLDRVLSIKLEISKIREQVQNVE